MLSRYVQSNIKSLPLRGFSIGRQIFPRGNRFQSTIPSTASNGHVELQPALISKATEYMKELAELNKQLSQGETFDVAQQKRFAHLASIEDAFQTYQTQLSNYKSLQELAQSDPSLKEEAQLELTELVPQLSQTMNELQSRLIPPHPFADKACILELRPGVGGTEAMIFTQDLLNMYIGYAHSHKWKYRILAQDENESGDGLVDAILNIDEPGSYDKLRFESGVHRVQRIPATETKGRTHTSTAAVVVLPQMGDDSDRAINAYERTFKPDEIRIDVMRARGKGGQHVNTTDSAVRLTHFPTGIVVSMQDERSQQKNKAKAFTILRARLAEREQKLKEEKERDARKEQVTTTDRSDKIRTYNYPQNRVTDHRCGLTLYALDAIMKGERLGEVIDAMRQFDDRERARLEF
ncbi:hypothetical protein NCAS_0D00690 [Naumovozyma castellii]|uniref:Peptide chain release factor 1, mitochondrial n=1 Tax=Naumovozyma castellii TaxID=27288 RepID=G0VEV5_NAUCA|nr:hypothetical protein NCAS_0D00690 [Naumovozyma castellii CBS 4309]CCC69650.1 hypothetical protein NCAS_0D00690 [Naumovozyma castellii CBS 4309]